MGEEGSITIASSGVKASIAPRGAELRSLQDAEGRDLLWNGDPAFWSGRSPLLFPIIGRLKDDQLTVNGKAYAMKQHGLVRTRDFALVSSGPDACHFQLRSDEATREAYPYDFVLDIAYTARDQTLSVAASVRNTGSGPLPASFGFHPAFRWPLPYGAPRASHEVVFEKAEPGPVRRLAGGLLTPEPQASPVQGTRLPVDDALFTADALIFLDPASRAVRFGPPDGPGLRVAFPLMPQLGLWSKPGAGFLCIEPWSGYASPETFEGDFAAKPGLSLIAPGDEQAFGLSITLDDGPRRTEPQ